MSSDILALGAAVLLLLANAFFVGAEFALISVRRTQIEPRVAAGSRAARITLRAMENVTLVMAGAQFGITGNPKPYGGSQPVLDWITDPNRVDAG